MALPVAPCPHKPLLARATLSARFTMKFKATLSDRGLRVLEKGFLPTLEKLGKRCQLLLSPEDVHLIQLPADTDGLQVTARLANVRVKEGRGGQAVLEGVRAGICLGPAVPAPHVA